MGAIEVREGAGAETAIDGILVGSVTEMTAIAAPETTTEEAPGGDHDPDRQLMTATTDPTPTAAATARTEIEKATELETAMIEIEIWRRNGSAHPARRSTPRAKLQNHS